MSHFLFVAFVAAVASAGVAVVVPFGGDLNTTDTAKK